MTLHRLLSSVLLLVFLAGCRVGQPAPDGQSGRNDNTSAVDDGSGGQEPVGNDDGDDGGEPVGGGGGRGSLFPAGSEWTRRIDDAPLDDESDEVIAWLADNGGWGLGRMQIDFSIEVMTAATATFLRDFIPTDDWYEVECDAVPIPVPEGGALEGESGYECTGDGDCHLIVIDEGNQQLFEMWRANIVDDVFYGGCLAVWDLTRVYGPNGRGRDCTSADAAGLPITALLVSADDVAAGRIDHALRFILPNARIRGGNVYVAPATHTTSATSGGRYAPPYGARLRLRADYPLESLPNDAARVVARAMQEYGMILSDGGNVALTFQSDRFTTAKWDDLLGPRDLDRLQVTDFEMVDGGERITYTGNCRRE